MDWLFNFLKGKSKINELDKNNPESGNERYRISANVPIYEGIDNIDASFNNPRHIFFQMDEILKNMLSVSSIDIGIISNDSSKSENPREQLLRDPNEVLPFSSSQVENSSVQKGFGFNYERISNDSLKNRNPREELLRDTNEFFPFSGFQSKGSSVLQEDGNDQYARYGPQQFMNLGARPEHHFHQKFSSIRRVHLPDGIVEEHRVTTDSEGNSTSTTWRSVGGKSHEIITHTDSKGVKETTENFKNLDENEVLDFQLNFPSFKNNQESAMDVLQNLPSSDIIPPPGDTSYLSLWKKFFMP